MEIENLKGDKFESNFEEKAIETFFVYFPIEEKFNKNLVSNIIFIGTLGHGSSFLTIKLSEKTKKIGYLSSEDKKSAPIIDIYYDESASTVFAIFNEIIHDIAYTNFSKIFFKQFSAEQVLVFHGVHRTKFGLSSEENYPKLRQLQTTQASLNKLEFESGVKKLENGKIIAGVPANIMTYCEINQISAQILIIVYQEYHLSIEDILIFDALKLKYPGICKEIIPKETKSKIAAISKKMFSKNLYL